MSDEHYDNGKLGLSCPEGGHFYVCEGNATEFVGCCDSNPCGDADGSCPTKDLRTSSFSADRYASIPEQSCDDARGARVWWTCRDNRPPFMGCCASDPCGEGCPRDHLIAAVLSDDDGNRLPFLPSPVTTSSTSSPTTSPTSSPSAPPDDEGSSGLSSGAIAGIAIGAAAAVAIFIILIWRCVRHARKSRDQPPSEQTPPFSPEMMAPQSPQFDKTRHSHLSYATTAIPPSYGSTPTSPQGQFQDAHHAHSHSPAISSQSYSPYHQYKDAEHARQGHLSHVSGVSALSGGIDSNLHTVSEIDGVEREAPRVELPADEAPPGQPPSSPPPPASPHDRPERVAEAPGSPGQWKK